MNTWQKHLYISISNGNTNKQDLIKETMLLIEKIANEPTNTPTDFILPEYDFQYGRNTEIILQEINDISGVGALPQNSCLKFDHDLTLIYGDNGTGKSSYVRILKAAEKKEFSKDVISNVFSHTETTPKATFIYTENNKLKQYDWNLTNSGTFPILVYDSKTARQLVEEENELLFEPKELSIITLMTQVIDEIANAYKTKQSTINFDNTHWTPQISETEYYKKFSEIKTNHNLQRLSQSYKFTEQNKERLTDLSNILQKHDLVTELKSANAKKAFLESERNDIKKLSALFSYATIKSLFENHSKLRVYKKACSEQEINLQEHSEMEGVGNTPWKTMMNAATDYIKSIDSSSNAMELHGRCPLCQQVLTSETNRRLQEFQAYINSQLQQQCKHLEDKEREAIQKYQSIRKNELNLSTINNRLHINALEDSTIIEITDVYNNYSRILDTLLSEEWKYDETLLCSPYTSDAIDEIFNKRIRKLEKTAETINKAITDKKDLENELNELLALRWISDNIDIKGNMLLIDAIINDCRTHSYTKLKTDLSEILITEQYISKFNEELKILDPLSHIHVELQKTSSRKGSVRYMTCLKGARENFTKKAGFILSEGEYRIVSLAGFFTDMYFESTDKPFVFDDPITSLDHKFEENVAKRLIAFTEDRQVIVFTHRLPFLYKLQELFDDEAKEYKQKRGEKCPTTCSLVELSPTPLGAPLYGNDAEVLASVKSITGYCRNLFQQTKAAQKRQDYKSVRNNIQILCKHIRLLAEKSIEEILIGGIVRRFKQEVSSQQVKVLNLIQESDVSLIDEMMTKYSNYEHSQSDEYAAILPQLDEVEKDFTKLCDWIQEYKKRKITRGF